MGQSAGSAASQHILNSPLTKRLIKGAIIEGGVRDPEDPLCITLAEGYITLEKSEKQGQEFMKSLNVSTLDELRRLPMADLETSLSTLGSTSQWSFNAVLDYYAMPDTYWNTLKQGLAHDVPVLTCNTKDESGAMYGLKISMETYLSDINDTYSGVWRERFLKLYPAHDRKTASGAENSQFTDRSNAGTWFWARLWNTARTSPVYNYFWDHAPPGQDSGA